MLIASCVARGPVQSDLLRALRAQLQNKAGGRELWGGRASLGGRRDTPSSNSKREGKLESGSCRSRKELLSDIMWVLIATVTLALLEIR